MMAEETDFWPDLKRALVQGGGAGLLLGLAFAGGFLYRGHLDRGEVSTTSFALLQEADGVLQQYYLYDAPEDTARIYGAVAGLAASYGDRFTYFVEPQTAEVDSTNLAGRFGGIGAEIYQTEAGEFFIGRVYRDNPAFVAGLEQDDQIIAVDNIDVTGGGYDLDGVVALIRGEVGTDVTLTIERGGRQIDILVTRDEVLIPSVFWNLVEDAPQIGYIRITRFTERAPEEVQQAIEALGEAGAEAYILDLRDNGGGLLDASVDVASIFLDGGVVLYEQRNNQPEEIVNATRGGPAIEVPLAVLMNENTASASEILAGALADRERAVLIGTVSYGKGSVQVIPQLSDGSSLHITTAEWFTPNHQRIQDNGLTPDIPVEPGSDSGMFLQAGIEYLLNQINP